jgi:hypothetical protein
LQTMLMQVYLMSDAKGGALQPERRYILRGMLAAFLVLFTVAAPAADPNLKSMLHGQILVKPNEGVSIQRMNAIAEAHSARVLKKLRGTGVYVVLVPLGSEAAIAQELTHHPEIDYAEVDLVFDPSEVSPNDPLYSDAWHLQTLNMPAAWDVSQGDGIIIAVLDSGVDAFHEDLAGRILPGWNAASDGTDTSDITGHGTRAAGIIGAISDNGIGVASISPGAMILPVRVTDLSSGAAAASVIASGLRWAADNGARVASISYAVTPSKTVSDAAQYMRNAGGVVVAAAGNTGDDPGHDDAASILTVSGTTSSDVIASWSSYGDFIDVAAPGAGIWTTNREGNYSQVSGTSFAAPVTAATTALVMAANPELSPDEVESILEFSAVDLGTSGWDPFYGHGRIDSAAALLLATAGPDSNGDGIPDVDAIRIGLDPNVADGDSDGDGISDVLEVGGDLNHPLDTDVDGIINALEPGADSMNATVASGLSLTDGVTVSISTATGEVLSSVSSSATTGGPSGIIIPLGLISYTTTSAVGGSVVIRMTFSQALPENLVLYKVNGTVYTALPSANWTQVAPGTIEMTVTDGDSATDLDGLVDGSIDDPVAIGTEVAAMSETDGDKTDSGGGGGGCVLVTRAGIDPVFPAVLLAALGCLYRWRKKAATR